MPGRLKRADKKFKDYWDHDTLHLTVTGAFAKSSNIGMILLAEQMSKETLNLYFEKLGCSKTPVSNYQPNQRD